MLDAPLDDGSLASVLVAALALLLGGLMIDRPPIRRIGRWKLPPSAPVQHDDVALAVLIALAVAFALIANP